MELQLDEQGIITPCASCGQKVRIAYARLGGSARCPKCKADIPAPGEPIEIGTTAEFEALVRASPLPVVVDYWAPWCGPCRMVAPEIARFAAANRGRYVVAKVNTEELPDIAERFGIQSIPTMTVFVGGREANRTVGAQPAARIQAFVDQSAGR
jgi:thioredoxin 2